MVKPEDAARQRIDAALDRAGWVVQDAKAVNIHAARGVAIREFLLKPGHGSADYLLYVWLKDEAQEDSASLPEPDVIAAEIAEDLRAALEQFEAIAADLAPAN